MTGFVRPATVEDAELLAPLLRLEDRRECLLITGLAPEVLLPHAVRSTPAHLTHTMVAHDTGSIIGMFGVSSMGMDGVGAVWLLATDDLPRHSRTFLRGSRAWVDRLHAEFPVLVNITDSRNTLHHRWIEWCGFTLIGQRPTPAGIHVIEFAKVKPT